MNAGEKVNTGQVTYLDLLRGNQQKTDEIAVALAGTARVSLREYKVFGVYLGIELPRSEPAENKRCWVGGVILKPKNIAAFHGFMFRVAQT